MDPLPPAFEPAAYRAHNPDLGALNDAAAEEHYRREGRAAGRIASALARREDLLSLLGDGRQVLEIGPFCRPLLRGPAVAYLDVLDADQLRARAEKLGIDPSGCPERIDHVGDLARVDRQFDAVVSSHSVEHQPDLVRHLREVARVLAADGAYFLIVPDKRYCFDHFLPESSIAQVLEAYQQGRRGHRLGSVVEHMALTTHNDAGRHWAGDHGDPARGRVERVRAAVERHEQARGGYVDVHAWQFTPDSFRETIATLTALDAIELEVAEVYDTPHGRNEFCAVLRLTAEARAAKHAAANGVELIVMQTADPIRYAPMLAVTQPNVAEYCRRHGLKYEALIGIARGFHPWQACFNRIAMFQALIARGYRGWALYLDTDAYVVDLGFDVTAYLARHDARGAILARAGVDPTLDWDVNNGIMFVNLGHAEGRRLIERWAELFAGMSDEQLRGAETWIEGSHDQDLLQRLLREEPALLDAIRLEDPAFINSPHARFIRQHVRAETPDLAARIRAIAVEVAAVMPPTQAGTAPAGEPRQAARLAHPPARELTLEEAPVPGPLDGALVDAILERWRATRTTPVPAYQGELAAWLDAGDRDALASALAGMGRQRFAQGVLGGARQHGRAADPLFARRLASWTHDRLVSLAEAIGTLDVESPEWGLWGENGRHAPGPLLRSIGGAIDADLAPPPRIGGYLGIATAPGVVLHLRMVEAIHAAWRVRDLARAFGLERPHVVEIGGQAGLTAFYARRLGLADYTVVAPAIDGVVQAAVLGGTDGLATRAAFLATGRTVDLLVSNDALPELPGEEGAALLRAARERGTRLLLSLDADGREGPTKQAATPVRDLVARAGGWRCVGRHRHWLRPGHVEELWRAAD